MRLARIFTVLATVLISVSPSATAQNTTHAPTKKTPDKPPAAPKPKKYLVEIYSVPSPCITPAFYSQPANLNQPLGAATTTTNAAPDPSTCNDSQLPVPSSISAADIVKIIASDSSYSSYDFEPVGSDKIAIYKKDTPPDPKKRDPNLDAIEKAISKSAASSPSLQFLKVIHVPQGGAKQAATLVSALSAGSITASPLDGDNSSLLLQSKTVPGKNLLAYIEQRISRLEQFPTPPTLRLFHLDASAVIKNLAPSGNSAADNGSSDTPAPAKTPPNKPAPGKKPAPASAAPPDPKPPSDASDSTPSISDQTSDASGNSAQKPAPADSPTDSSPKPPDMKAVNDTVVFSNADGSDRGIFERDRLMAVLDLPRPEVLLNMWALQASSRDYKVTNTEAEAVRTAVAQHNQLLQDAIDDGWSFLSRQMAYTPAPGQGAFFNKKFYNYITQKFALNPKRESEKPEDFKRIEDVRRAWGWCDPNTYCLGFSHAFEPLRPTFTNILLAIIAANNPAQIAQQTIQSMDGECPPTPAQSPETPCPLNTPQPLPPESSADQGQVDNFRRCLSDRTRDIQTAIQEGGQINAPDDCELADRLTLAAQVKTVASPTPHSEHLQLNCFKNQAKKSFQGWPEDPDNPVEHHQQTTRVGLLRAAVADFLFNYKWATQYPHSFIPYDLSQSAQELNAELNPLILAFNRDVSAFTQSLQGEMECKYRSTPRPGWFGKGDETFLNDGMIAVRGISGVESIVDTITQSYFDATKPPNLTDLVKSVSDAEKNIPGVLKTNLSANEAAVLLGALNSVQPAEARIGRQLKLDITPHALAGASSAELDVKLTAEEAGSPTLYTAGKSSDDTLSRVATHDTTTKVRVESLKLFEVSAFSAMLQRPRSKFPILPPFFEVPYFGSFISYPIRGARIYHRSTAIVSAVIVPTAADLAYGIDFTDDRVCHPPDSVSAQSPASNASTTSYGYTCAAAASPSDFPGRPLRNFHKAMVQCLATQQQASQTGTQAPDPNAPATSPVTCANLTFETIPPSQ
jgi:hypothetical protein